MLTTQPIFKLQLPSRHLKRPGLVIDNPHILYDAIQTPHELLVRRVLCQIVIPALYTPKEGNESMRKYSLSRRSVSLLAG